MNTKRTITRDDILALEEFERERAALRERYTAARRVRRLEVGPFLTFYFENYDTMWWQIHEMLRIEKGGEAQIADELEAYNPLIPQGAELIATVMIEIPEAQRRARELVRLGGIEKTMSLHLDGERIAAEPVGEDERTTAEGKTSSVHFVRVCLDPAQAAKFRDPRVEAVVAVDHAHYAHRAVVPAPVRRALIEDLEPAG